MTTSDSAHLAEDPAMKITSRIMDYAHDSTVMSVASHASADVGTNVLHEVPSPAWNHPR